MKNGDDDDEIFIAWKMYHSYWTLASKALNVYTSIAGNISTMSLDSVHNKTETMNEKLLQNE